MGQDREPAGKCHIVIEFHDCIGDFIHVIYHFNTLRKKERVKVLHSAL
jgi:hypothetical protein